MKKITILFLTIAVMGKISLSQDSVKLYPSHWWVGMKWNKVQIMLHGNDIGKASGYSINYPGVQLDKVNKVENRNYVFLDIIISERAKPGTVKIATIGFAGHPSLSFELKSRRKGNGTLYAQGIRSSDLVYLLMPDRFSNGDTTNDRIPGMKDQSLNRKEIFDRHGGDLQGIVNHLDYLQGLGVTTVWPTPVLENDMPNRTEHGYACTDHYTIDPRLGGAKWYHALSDSLHSRGMKLIQDIVYNHVGLQHFTVQDPPMKDWLHQWPVFTNPNYKDQALFDPHASQAIIKRWLTDGSLKRCRT